MKYAALLLLSLLTLRSFADGPLGLTDGQFFWFGAAQAQSANGGVLITGAPFSSGDARINVLALDRPAGANYTMLTDSNGKPVWTAWASMPNMAWAKIASTPTTAAGYGITDSVVTSGSYSNPSWLTGLAWSKVSATPTTITGYGISDAVSTGGSYSTPSWLTAISASILTSGTLPDGRFPSTLPALSGVNLTALNASNLSSGTVTAARLGTGSVGSGGKVLADNGTWITPNAGTVTSVTLSSSNLTVAGTNPVTSTGTISVNLPNTGTAGTYVTVTTDAQGRVTAGNSLAFTNNASRATVATTASTGFQLDASRSTMVNYYVVASTTATISGPSTAGAYLEICPTNSTTPGDWITLGPPGPTAQTITLAIVLQSVQGVPITLSGVVPGGYYCRVRSATTGTASVSANATGQEVKM